MKINYDYCCGEEKMARLVECLIEKKLYDELEKAAVDIDFRNELYSKHGIKDVDINSWADRYIGGAGQLSLMGVLDDAGKKKPENNVFNLESWDKREIYLERREKTIERLLQHKKVEGDMSALVYYLNCVKNLAAEYPDVALEWDYEEEKHTPLDYTVGSSHKASWICFNGHKFKQQISQRTSGGHGCPYCAGKKVVKGVSDLETWCRNNDMLDIIDEWDGDKNEKKPSDYMPFSNARVHWICSEGHEFTAVIEDRVRSRYRCPYCKKKTDV